MSTMEENKIPDLPGFLKREDLDSILFQCIQIPFIGPKVKHTG